MDFQNLVKKALRVREKYDEFSKRKGRKAWGAEQVMQGFVGDVGDLSKLVMEKEDWRKLNGPGSIGHELSDCPWSIIILADKYGIDLEKEFEKTMEELEEIIDNDVDH